MKVLIRNSPDAKTRLSLDQIKCSKGIYVNALSDSCFFISDGVGNVLYVSSTAVEKADDSWGNRFTPLEATKEIVIKGGEE